jgi:hypothetical protein
MVLGRFALGDVGPFISIRLNSLSADAFCSINYAYKNAYVWKKNNVFVQVILGSSHTYDYHPGLISIDPKRHGQGKESSIPLQYFKI